MYNNLTSTVLSYDSDLLKSYKSYFYPKNYLTDSINVEKISRGKFTFLVPLED